MAINWALLGAGRDPGQAAQEAFETGRARGRQRAAENALAGYAAAPSQATLNALLPYDPQAYAALSKVQTDRDAQLRAAEGRATYARYLRQHAPDAPAASATPEATAPAAAAAVMGGEPGDVVVTAPQPKASIADVAELDPELAASLTKHLADMDDAGRKAFGQKTAVAASVALAAKSVPLAQRQAFIDDNRDLLRESGWSDREVDAFDPHDDNLDGMAAIGVGADKWLSDQRQAAGQAVTVRGQDVSAATARRGQDIGAATARAGQAVTMRGQDIGAATAAANREAAAARKVAPSAASVTLARGKLNSLSALERQLDRAEKALSNAKNTGPLGGRLPGGISGADDAADAAIANLAPLVRQLTRVPGEGAMSDYESRLAQAGLPSRVQTRQARAEALGALRDLISATRAGYADVAGEAQPATAHRRFKVIR